MEETIPSYIGSKLGQQPPEALENASEVLADNPSVDDNSKVVEPDPEKTEAPPTKPLRKVGQRKSRRKRNVSPSEAPAQMATANLSKEPPEAIESKNTPKKKIPKTKSIRKHEGTDEKKSTQSTDSKISILDNVSEEIPNKSPDKAAQARQEYLKKISNETGDLLRKIKEERIQRSKEVIAMRERIRQELDDNQKSLIETSQALEASRKKATEQRTEDLQKLKKDVHNILKN